MEKSELIDALDEAIYTMEKMLAGRNPYYNEEPGDMREADIIIGMRENWGISWHVLNAFKNHISQISENDFRSDANQETYGHFLDMDYGDDDHDDLDDDDFSDDHLLDEKF